MPQLREAKGKNAHRPLNGAAAPKAKRSPFVKITDTTLGRSRQRPVRAPMLSLQEQAARMAVNPFAVDFAKLHPESVLPPSVVARIKGADGPKLAMDDTLGASAPAVAWAGNLYASAFAEGMTFMGYPYLAELSQRGEYRNMVDVVAEEMTRKWIRLESLDETAERKKKSDDEDRDDEYANDRLPPEILEALRGKLQAARAGEDVPKVDNGGSTDKSKKIKELDDFLRHLNLQQRMKTFVAHDGYFGRAHLYCDVNDAYRDAEELKKPLGDGYDAMSKLKMTKGGNLELRNVEPVWCYPMSYNSNDPLAPDWYNPSQWFVMAKETHKSRLLTGVGRPVPDLLKPAYSFGGMPLTQIAKPYVDNWLRTRQSVADLLHAFTVFWLASDLNTLLQQDGDEFFRRIDLFNNTRDNRGLMLINKEVEELGNIAVPLGTLDALQAQTQEHMAAVSRIPLVKLLGIQPMGLNADSEGVMRAFYDTIHGQQEWLLRPAVKPIVGFAQLALWGEVDPEINFLFEPLKELDEKGEAEVEKLEAETDVIRIDAGIIDPAEARLRLAQDPGSPYHGIDPNDVPEPPEPEMPPSMGGGAGGDNPGGNTPDRRGGGFGADGRPFLVQ